MASKLNNTLLMRKRNSLGAQIRKRKKIEKKILFAEINEQVRKKRFKPNRLAAAHVDSSGMKTIYNTGVAKTTKFPDKIMAAHGRPSAVVVTYGNNNKGLVPYQPTTKKRPKYAYAQ